MNIASSSVTNLSSAPRASAAEGKTSAPEAGFQSTLDSSLQAAKTEVAPSRGPGVNSGIPSPGVKKQVPASSGSRPEKKDEARQRDGNGSAPNVAESALLVPVIVTPVLPILLEDASSITAVSGVSGDKAGVPSQPLSAENLTNSRGSIHATPAMPAQIPGIANVQELAPLATATSGGDAASITTAKAMAVYAAQGSPKQDLSLPAPQASSLPRQDASLPVSQMKVPTPPIAAELPIAGQFTNPGSADAHAVTLRKSVSAPEKASESAPMQGVSAAADHKPVSQAGISNARVSGAAAPKPEIAAANFTGALSAAAHGQQGAGKQEAKTADSATDASTGKTAASASIDQAAGSQPFGQPVGNGIAAASAVIALAPVGSPGAQPWHSATSTPATGAQTSGGDASSVATLPQASPGPVPAINTARVLEHMSGTEMRVGMHTSEFGSISIATSVSGSGIAAQIALDHGALGKALAVHLPGMEEKLGNALGMAARVEVRDTGAQSSGGGSAETANREAFAQNFSQGGGKQNRGGESIDSRSQHIAEVFHGGIANAESIVEAGDGRLSVRV